MAGAFENIGWFVGGLVGGAGGGLVRGSQGAVVGGGVGFVGGAAVGAVVGAPTGPGEVLTIPSGAVAGAVGGAALGGAYGASQGIREGAPVGAEVGTGAGRWLDQKLANMMKGEEEAEKKPDVPPNTVCSGCGDYVGTQDKKSGDRGDRHNSGPLDPANGGTGNAENDFDVLTGGNHQPAGANLPPGSKIGQNGTIYRPAAGSSGPRIDIPASGGKLHETLHY